MKILVFCWAGHQNLGDELFKDAFIKLFPEHTFVFSDRITKKLLDNAEALFVGGGSFLDSEPHVEPAAYDALRLKPIFYIGVGVETAIHPKHAQLMARAKLIATRSEEFEKIKELNANVIHIPDIVYCLENAPNIKRIDKSILYLPNIYTVPHAHSPHWEHVAWEHFTLEFSQVLDYLIDDGYKIDIFAMCKNKIMDDAWAGIEVSNRMVHRKNYEIPRPKSCIDLFAKYSIVITQRYHGIVLSELAKTPYLAIHHHDKLKPTSFNRGSFISYFGASKDTVLEKIINIDTNCFGDLLINSNKFKELKDKVSALLKG